MKRFILALSAATLLSLSACANSSTETEIKVVPNTEEKDQLTFTSFQKELEVILNDINEKVEVGTAGSSLKAVEPTAQLMNWSLGAQLSDEQIDEVMKAKLNNLSEDEKESFIEQLKLLDATYKTLLSDIGNDLLESAGKDRQECAWLDIENLTSLEAFEMLMTSAGLR